MDEQLCTDVVQPKGGGNCKAVVCRSVLSRRSHSMQVDMLASVGWRGRDGEDWRTQDMATARRCSVGASNEGSTKAKMREAKRRY